MDEIKLIEELTASEAPASNNEEARARARLALLERANPAATDRPPRAHGSSARRLLAFAGAGAVAAIVAGILLVSSGPNADSAAAQVLQETAQVAAADDSQPAAQPEPDQFLYSKTKSVGFDSWIPDDGPSDSGAANAMVEMSHETWYSPNGAIRAREAMGPPQFLSSVDQKHWEAAGRPLPRGAFDPSDPGATEGIVSEGGRVLEAAPGLIDYEDPTPRKGSPSRFPDVSGVPTDPAEFRRAVREHRDPALSLNVGGPAPLDSRETVAAIWGFLSLPNTTPELRATAFNALAELPGIELDRHATDLVGRDGYAIGFDEAVSGTRSEYIFDPETSEILGQRISLNDSEKFSGSKGLPVGLTINETVYLQSGVVDSTHETVEDRNGGPVAKTGPIYER